MKITKEEVEKVAALARLEFTDEEKEMFTNQLNIILDYFDTLKALDTREVEPTFHVSAIRNVFRDDEVGPSISREESLLNAPDRKGGCFRVPRIIE
ncbi:MAG: Asp-tRNA(Asn)/Glu-tRNA(Gln) amidotransferase subunit GatC [Pseudomonadota bacterium]